MHFDKKGFFLIFFLISLSAAYSATILVMKFKKRKPDLKFSAFFNPDAYTFTLQREDSFDTQGLNSVIKLEKKSKSVL
ncbi:MAG TPA: hypothetical protein VKY57_08320 [Chitinispirillaceae bacterium]|nr:hypothetical protein [Fibrobacter sp.]HLV31555.1 hypothetical protein [Chitinispirillaceae bacterium]